RGIDEYGHRSAHSALVQAALYGVLRRAGADLSDRLRADQLPLFLRCGPAYGPRRNLAGKPAARLGAGGRHPAAAGAVGCRLSRRFRGDAADRNDSLYVRRKAAAVHARPVILPFLAAIRAGVAGLAARL